MKKKRWCGCRPLCLVPTGEKPKRMETNHPKAGSEPKNVRLCSLMFAYVRLCSLNWKKNVEARPAESSGQSSLIQAKLFLNPIESASQIRKKRRFNDLGHDVGRKTKMTKRTEGLRQV